ncbi:TRAP transporter small permease [Oceanicola sp. 22II-s10i]|uniref:TRAP transporter small permease n=1 Tax=Oceanicola sp. 22II-s10i TaxID=1317116 RepID=UPI000B526503|nr:TRAP transporter small permease [Oceanicola sp. 22II-s10i]
MRATRFISDVSTAPSVLGAYVAMPLIAILVTTDVVLRYVFNAPLWWALEASEYLLLLFFMSGLAWSLRLGVHIRMGLLYEKLTRTARRIVSVIYATAVIVPFSLVALAATEEAMFLHGLGKTTNDLEMPLWLWNGAVALACILLVLQALALAIEVIIGERDTLEDAGTGGH